MPNSIITPQWVTNETARLLLNNCKFATNVTRWYGDEFQKSGAKVGYTVQARLPQRYQVNKGQVAVIQSVQDTVTPVTITDQANVAIAFGTAQTTMEVSMYRARYIMPAVEALATQLDVDGLSRMYQSTFNSVGTPGTSPTANSTYLAAKTLLTNSGCPMDNRKVLINPGMMAAIVNANTGVFNPARTISEAFKTGAYYEDVLGFSEWWESSNVAMATIATYLGTPVINGTNQTGTTLSIRGFTAASTTLTTGTIFTVANVFAVNPANYASTGGLQQFTVMADASDAAGVVSVTISPAMISQGAYATINSLVVDGATVTIVGVSATANAAQGLAFHQDAFVLAWADLEYFESAVVKARIQSKQYQVAARFQKGADIINDVEVARLDFLYGYANIRPQLACRIQGGA